MPNRVTQELLGHEGQQHGPASTSNTTQTNTGVKASL
jgi:hypothetical protein